ncbi:hypothetical protein Taro_033337 [Colocasia esculenta]|uniref:Uncharacterized protein n=1 Tax=Colocasia esculenta TaxID=4460 RepID=A0A843WC79_COLES|nr:hypothetical protein [Colocasia esculenta]
MARAGGALVCLLVVILDMVAGILGIEAQTAQNKAWMKHMKVLIFECKEPSHKAYQLGLAAAVLLAIAHAVGNLLGGCNCILSTEELNRSSGNKKLAAATLIISWVVVIVGFSLLLIGAMSNSKSRASCGLAHHNFLAVGGILCFVHGLFCASYYVAAKAVQWEEEKAHHRKEVTMPPAANTGGGQREHCNP